MDKKLLDALNNLSIALEEIANALNSKESAKSDTANALKSGDVANKLELIDKGIKSLQEDNKKILKNQETLISLSKKETNKTEIFGEADENSNKNKIIKGAGIILLIAGAVLAIGMAFKIVGNVDFLSVVTIASAITLLSITFEKLSNSKLTFNRTLALSKSLLLMAGALVASSWIMLLTAPISIAQGLTLIFISSVFMALSHNLDKIFLASLIFKKLNVSPIQLTKTLVSIAGALTASSWILKLIAPMSIAQGLTAIAIAGMFALVTYNLVDIGLGVLIFDKLNVNMLVLFETLVGIATAITVSSWILNGIMPISIGQALTAIAISAMFAVISLTIPFMAIGLGIMKKYVGSIYLIPILYTTIALAITASSLILSGMEILSPSTYSAIIGLSLSLSISSVVLALAFAAITKIGNVTMFIEGALSLLIIAGTIAATSYILSLGKYDKYPSFDWIMGVGISILAFGAAVGILGAIAMTGIGAVAMAAGTGVILGLAGTIYLTSIILDKGKYNKYPNEKWIKGTSKSMVLFTETLSKMGLSGILLNAIGKLFGSGPVDIAKNILETDIILSKGAYKVYPNGEWSKNVGELIKTFALNMNEIGLSGIVLNAIGDFFGSGPVDIAENIVEVDEVISKGTYAIYPTAEWVDGITSAFNKFSTIRVGNIDGAVEMAEKISEVGDKLSKSTNTVMNTANAYDRLANSIIKLSNASNNIDISKINNINPSIGRGIELSNANITPNVNKPNETENVNMGNIFKKGKEAVMNFFTSDEKEETTNKTNNIEVKTNVKKEEKSEKSIDDLYNVMTSVNSNLAMIVNYNRNFSNYINEIRTSKNSIR